MSKGKKTIVILTPGFPESEADSTCLPMQQSFVRSLKEIYPQLNIIVLSFQYPYFTKKYNWFGIPVISFDGRNNGGLSKLLLKKKINATLNRIQSNTPITGLLSFWYNECASIGKRFADKFRIKHYCWILGQDAKKENKYVKRIPPEPEELVALSDFLQEEFEKNHSIRPSHVIPPGIDLSEFSKKNFLRDIDVLGVGSLIPLKRYDIFLDVIYAIKKFIPEIKAVLCGKGAEESRLQLQIDRLGLKNNVPMIGEIPHHEVIRLMQRSRILLHPSSYEGFSGVCQESLFAGTHVISFSYPMKKNIAHWHVVNHRNEMIKKVLEILKNQQTIYVPVSVYSMSDTVKAMMNKFDA